MSILITAIEFATEHHKHQFRKGTRIPYLCHLFNVCKILAEKNCSEEVLVGGLLHDIVEDTEVTIEEIKERFGVEVYKMVKAATEPFKLQKVNDSYDQKHTWHLRKLKTISYLERTATFDESLIILADKLDNIKNLRDDLKAVGDSVWYRFNADKKNQQWYYESILRSLEGRPDKNLYPLNELIEEFKALVNEVFPVKIEYDWLEFHPSGDDSDGW